MCDKATKRLRIKNQKAALQLAVAKLQTRLGSGTAFVW